MMMLAAAGCTGDTKPAGGTNTGTTAPDTNNALTNPADSSRLQGDTGRQPVANAPAQ